MTGVCECDSGYSISVNTRFPSPSMYLRELEGVIAQYVHLLCLLVTKLYECFMLFVSCCIIL